MPSAGTSSALNLQTADAQVHLAFTPSLSATADELRRLWAHVLVDDEETASGAAGAMDAADAVEEGTANENDAEKPLSLTFATVDEKNDSPGSSFLKLDDPGNGFIVSGRITSALIRSKLGARILLHAGAVHTDDLGTVLVVGPSGAGKSTATIELGRHGDYLTDELTILDPQGFSLTPFPKPVSRVVPRRADPSADDDVDAALVDPRDPRETRLKIDVSLDDLGLTPGASTAPPSHILILDRQEGDVPVSAERTPTIQALHQLVSQSSSTWLVPNGLTQVMHLLDHCGGALTVRYTEASDLVAQLPTLVQTAPQHPEWHAVGGGEAPAPPAGEYAVTAFTDVVAADEQIVILRQGSVVTTSGLAALVWDVIEQIGPCSREHLYEEITGVLGDNDQAAELLDKTLESLIDEKLVALGT